MLHRCPPDFDGVFCRLRFVCSWRCSGSGWMGGWGTGGGNRQLETEDPEDDVSDRMFRSSVVTRFFLICPKWISFKSQPSSPPPPPPLHVLLISHLYRRILSPSSSSCFPPRPSSSSCLSLRPGGDGDGGGGIARETKADR